MLSRSSRPNGQKSRQHGRKKWSDAQANVPSIGCSVCPDYRVCGGLFVSEPLFWCLDYCCRNPEKCDAVCRNNPNFVDRIREVGGFSLANIARVAPCAVPTLPSVLPMIFHGSARKKQSRARFVALPFTRMFDRRTGMPRFRARDELCQAFKISEEASIVLSGTDKDAPIEGWWGIGKENRKSVARHLKSLGVTLVTAPNFSTFTDQPRWDNLHAIKRIALAQNEIQEEGLQTALHINGRTEHDFSRWTDYLMAHPEIEYLAYEFTTGPGWIGRRELHVEWLSKLALQVGRPLHLIVRGGIEIVPNLLERYAAVTFIDTAAFMKTMKRRRAAFTEQGNLIWRTAATEVGEPLDELLTNNVATVTTWILNQLNLRDALKLSA